MDKEKLPLNIRTIVEDREKALDRIRGCMFGGAAGDALGYPVEFLNIESIHNAYGPSGISSYTLDPVTGLALVSDDTQMSMFTANGLLYAQTRTKMKKLGVQPRYYVYLAYLDWLETQRGISHGDRISWLSEVKALWNCRAPGATCLDALSSGEQGSTENRINHSKGCGGVMRVAPVGLFYRYSKDEEVASEGAEVAALTHSHSLGFMPAAFLSLLIKQIVNAQEDADLSLYVENAKETISVLFAQRKHLGGFVDIIDKAVALSGNDCSDEDNIPMIGAGWCGDEALAIAIYCALRYQNDFSKAITAAVNHSGDSDSTGALTGNLVGAHVGYEAIDGKWKENLEMRDTILEIADDLCYGCLMDDSLEYVDVAWMRKYVNVGKE